MEYIDARAVKSYEPYYFDNSGSGYSDNTVLISNKEQVYVNDIIRRFVTGELSAGEENAWKSFCEKYIEVIDNVKDEMIE